MFYKCINSVNLQSKIKKVKINRLNYLVNNKYSNVGKPNIDKEGEKIENKEINDLLDNHRILLNKHSDLLEKLQKQNESYKDEIKGLQVEVFTIYYYSAFSFVILAIKEFL